MILKDLDIQEIPEEFLCCEVMYKDEWCGYEESGWVVVFDFFGELFLMEYQDTVMSLDKTFVFDPEPITIDELFLIIEEWGYEDI